MKAGSFILMVVIGIFLCTRRDSTPKEDTAPIDQVQSLPAGKIKALRAAHSQATAAASAIPLAAEEAPAPAPVEPVIPVPLHLYRRVLAQKNWNDGEDAFGLERPEGGEGAILGPSSVLYANGNIYVLDTVNARLLGYDETGNLLTSVALPETHMVDVIVDLSDGALLLIDQLRDRIYKVQGNELIQHQELPIRSVHPFGTKFAYDAEAGVLIPQNDDAHALTEIQDNHLILRSTNGEKALTIAFDKPLVSVEEAVADPGGNVWVLYSLEGDYRKRRLARIDPERKTAGVTEIDVWFAFDATRHMTVTRTGVAVFAGDQQGGRLLAFDYLGEQ